MKKIFSILALTIISCTCFSQLKKKDAKLVSERGYWMIESNLKTPKASTIYFYTNDNVVIYQESVQGIKVKPNKQKTRIRLKEALEQAITAWEKGKKANEDTMLVATALKR